MFVATTPTIEYDNINKNSYLSPMRLNFRLLMPPLESNFDEKSRLYKEDAMGHFFDEKYP